eukprot:TRINITY_DN6526_c0_g1_i4.p1 TRINITY_DN6526_c0_g1~~TRINITY_DN6526_c0_g1_i4.p1  ORF type:complete len:626 (-),score=112.63 TRINITY_DN6526_c0_g1_i4:540-2417(-)
MICDKIKPHSFPSRCCLRSSSHSQPHDSHSEFCVLYFSQGILQKAETHFTAGDFEQALVFYHRGGKIRPDMEEFRLGIQKAKEAIDDALFGPVIDPGSPRERMSGLNSSRPGSSSGPVDTYRSYASSKPESTGPKSMRSSHFSASNASLTSKAKSQSHPMSATQSSLPQKPTGQHSNATSRRLLGKLYDDKKYLESLAQDKALNKRNTKIQTLAESGLQFLGKREEFWKQQNANDCERQMSPPLRPTSASMADYLVRQSDLASKPALSKSSSRVSNRLYSAGTSRSSQASYQHIPAKKAAHPSHPARRKQESPPSHVFSDQYSSSDGEMNVHNSRKSTEKNARPSSAGFKLKRQTYIEDTQVLVHTLQLINNALSHGDAEATVRVCRELLSRLGLMDIPDKPRLIATLFYQLGRGFMDLARYNLAAVYFRKDLELAVEYNFKDAVLRSLGQLGLAHQRMGDFEQALSVFDKKLALAPESETPQTYLSIGLCHNDAGEFAQGLQYSVMCLSWLHDRSTDLVISETTALQLRMRANCLAGCCLMGLNRLREAVTKFEAHAQYAKTLDDPLAHAEALTLLATCHTKLGDSTIAQDLTNQASLLKQTARQARGRDKKKPGSHTRRAADD